MPETTMPTTTTPTAAAATSRRDGAEALTALCEFATGRPVVGRCGAGTSVADESVRLGTVAGTVSRGAVVMGALFRSW
jgi:hypothetical protein